MTAVVPCPDPADRPYNVTETETLDQGQRLTATFEPSGATTRARLPIVAMSKYPGATYTIRIDGETRYGPAQVPPTDIDDSTVTFLPAFRWNDSVEAIVRNVSGGNGRETTVQIIGWEEIE